MYFWGSEAPLLLLGLCTLLIVLLGSGDVLPGGKGEMAIFPTLPALSTQR